MSDNFRLSDAQWAVAPLLPMVHTGPRDRRIISGSLHRRARAAAGTPCRPNTGRIRRCSTVTTDEEARPVAGYFGARAWPNRQRDDDREHRGAGAPGGERRKGGAGPSHRPLARWTHHQDPCPDRPGEPAARVPATSGNIADITVAAPLLEGAAASARLIGDKGYDADHLRALLDRRGTIAVIPNKSNRKRIFPFDAERYKWRNLIERTNCRLKDFRAIATRYDKLARNFLTGLCLVTALLYWCD
jgi:transposase